MSLVVPFLAVVLTGLFAAYHRMRLATWVAMAAAALVACWLLGASATATVVAAVLLALIAVPLLVAPLEAWENSTCSKFSGKPVAMSVTCSSPAYLQARHTGGGQRQAGCGGRSGAKPLK